VGDENLKGRKSVHCAPKDEQDMFQEFTIVDTPKPLGGKWGQANAVILPFAEDDAPEIDSIVGLLREDLLDAEDPRLDDLIGTRVVDRENNIEGIIQNVHSFKNQKSVEITIDEATIEIPLQWFDLKKFKPGEVLEVEDLKQWLELGDE